MTQLTLLLSFLQVDIINYKACEIGRIQLEIVSVVFSAKILKCFRCLYYILHCVIKVKLLKKGGKCFI